MAKRTYTAQTAIEHDGRRYELGEPIDLEDVHAEPLLQRGAVLAAMAKRGRPKKDDAATEGGEGGDDFGKGGEGGDA